MKTELLYLTWVTVLTGLLWLPYILDRISVWGLSEATLQTFGECFYANSAWVLQPFSKARVHSCASSTSSGVRNEQVRYSNSHRSYVHPRRRGFRPEQTRY
jgi:hypothetical protein